MKEQLVVSKEQLVASIEQGLNHVPEQPKPVELNSWQLKIQILKFILYFELVLFTAWLLYSAWQSHQTQYGEIKVFDGDVILHRSNLMTDEGTPQRWTNDLKKNDVDDDLPNENMIVPFTMQSKAQVDSDNKKTSDENRFIEQVFDSPRRIDPDIEKLIFSSAMNTDSIPSENEEKTGKSDSIPLTLEDLIIGSRMNRVFYPDDDQSKGEISILDVEDTKVLSNEPKPIWFPKIIQDDMNRKVNPFSDNPILRNMNAQILYLETQGDDKAFLKRLISGDQTFQDMLRNVLKNQDRTPQVNTYDELPQTIFETSDENLQRYFKHSNPDAQKYFDRKSQGSDFSENINQVLNEMRAIIAKKIELSRSKEEGREENEALNEFLNSLPSREIIEKSTSPESSDLSSKNDVTESESMGPEYRKSGENYEIMLPFGMSWIISNDDSQSKDSLDEKSQETSESDETREASISKSEEPTTIKSTPDDFFMTTWSLFFPQDSTGKSSESNIQETSIPTSEEQTATEAPSSDSSSLEWFIDFPLINKQSDESSVSTQSKEKMSAENLWFPFMFGESKEDKNSPSTEDEVKEDSSTDLERNFKPEGCQLLNIQGGFKVYDCSHPKSTKQIIDEPNPIVWDENYGDYMYSDDYDESDNPFERIARVIAPTPEIPLGDDKMIEEDLASMRKQNPEEQDSVSAGESMEKKENQKEGAEASTSKDKKLVTDSLSNAEEDEEEDETPDETTASRKPQQVDTVTTPQTPENEESDTPTDTSKSASNLKPEEEDTSDISSENEHREKTKNRPNPYLSPYVVDNSSPNREVIDRVDPDLKYEAVMRSLDIVKYLGFTKEKNHEYNQILNKIYSECVDELSAYNSWREGNDDQTTENQGKICVSGKSFDDKKMRPLWRQKLSFVSDMEDAGTVEESKDTEKNAKKENKLSPDSETHM